MRWNPCSQHRYWQFAALGAIALAFQLACSGEENAPAANGSDASGGSSGAGASGAGGVLASGGVGGSVGSSGAAGSGGTADGAVGSSGAAGTAATGGAGGTVGAGGTGGSSGSGGAAPSSCGTVPVKVAPPLPAATGTVVEVSTVGELTSAVSTAANGTTILINDGTYYLPGLLRFNNGKTDISLRSKSGNRDAVILDGSQSSSGEMIWFEQVRNVTVADITVQNANVHCFTIKGEADADGVRIYNCKLRNCWERYIKGTAPNPIPADASTRPRNGRIEYCRFEQDYKKTRDDAFNGDYIGGIDMMWLKNWVISDNVFRGIQGRNNGGRAAIFIWNNSEDVIVERNHVLGCDTGLAFGNPSGAATHVTRGVMRNNMVTRGNYKAIELARTSACEIYNNTVYSDMAFDRAFHAFQGSDGIRIFNNLMRGWGIRADDAGSTVENNLTGDFPSYFVDPAQGLLHLTSAGAAAAFGQGQAVPAGIGDHDREPRPAQAALGADECTR